MPPNLPPGLIQLIREGIPTLQAAELLLFFAANPERELTPEEIVVAIRPTVVTVPAVKEYAALLVAAGAISETDGRFRYAPAGRGVEEAIGQLAAAYNERPVTLIGSIYRIADAKLQSFSDSFKLRED